MEREEAERLAGWAARVLEEAVARAASELGELVPEESRAHLLKAERDNYMLAECKERADKYPSDLIIRFELGQLYLQAGKITEAIQEFQKAQNNPNKRIAALNGLGQCFARRNMNDLAAKTLEKALSEKQVFDEEKMDLTYSLGSILEKMGKKEAAIEQYKKIYEVDVSFKDIAKKVDDYYAGH